MHADEAGMIAGILAAVVGAAKGLEVLVAKKLTNGHETNTQRQIRQTHERMQSVERDFELMQNSFEKMAEALIESTRIQDTMSKSLEKTAEIIDKVERRMEVADAIRKGNV